MPDGVLQLFSGSTGQWFQSAFGRPTRVQEEAWPAISAGKPVLVSAPTGTGKTLSAFLLFIDRLNALAAKGELKQELYVLYVSPLKSLAGDIRENLRRPLDGIKTPEGQTEIEVALRTGDTPQRERQRMVKRPPHILITTPESLYLMLTSKTGRHVLHTARTVIVDELHALMDTKRGAHLMLSIARLDALCGQPLQRIGLSATIEPLSLAAEYLSPERAVIVAPPMEKQVEIKVIGTVAYGSAHREPVWERLAETVYRQCLRQNSVIAFTEGRRYAEKLAYYVNQLAGTEFARVHHGSLAKEKRDETEQALRAGSLRLLCATSSMELGIDVGDIDLVLQVGCPRTISGTMQRLGRAGHNPGRPSVMYMYPRTASESISCGMTAQVAREGGVEHCRPPRLCFDVLAQHLVSMAAAADYTVEEVLHILSGAYPFQGVQKEDVQALLCMLAGDYEHSREIPVRPRVLYDRIHERVSGDAYSRMLAVSAGGTIPDKGLYHAKTEDGVILGELDEEFVYESQLGDRFLLGAFGWRIVRQDKDAVYVEKASAEGARLPFWKGETKGGDLRTARAFGAILHGLEKAKEAGGLPAALHDLGLDETAAEQAEGLLQRQIASNGSLADDRTIVVEHFKDSTGSHQIMVHAMLGRRVNAPLALLLQHAAGQRDIHTGCVDEEDGFLLYAYGEEAIPEGLLYDIMPEQVRPLLEAMLPQTPLFGMTFRYNAARALMMGMRGHGRQPLWMQRLRSTEMLDSLMHCPEHPLIRETRRECLEELWDIDGVMEILAALRSGQMTVREVYNDVPSPMSLPFQWKTESEEMYAYNPVTPGIRQAVYDELAGMERLKPGPEELKRQQERKKQPENAAELHSLLMIEGDLLAGELAVPVEWLEELTKEELALYVEPGLWIAAEHAQEYGRALSEEDSEAAGHIVRRMLYYRGGQTAGEIRQRYLFSEELLEAVLQALCEQGDVVEDDGIFYHGKLYERARKAAVYSRRQEIATRPSECYAALLAGRAEIHGTAQEQLGQIMARHYGSSLPAGEWEGLALPGRVKHYSPSMLDKLLSEGDYFWKLLPGGRLCFLPYESVDWEAGLPESGELSEEERRLYEELKKRGASFLKALTQVPREGDARELLLSLAEKGLVCADSFVPVRQWLDRDKMKKAAARQRVNARVAALSAGRWDVVRPLVQTSVEELLEACFREYFILCRETFQLVRSAHGLERETDWRQALSVLRVWEYTGRARRGYFVEGLSGAQFVKDESYAGITAALAAPGEELIWLNAADMAQAWGRVLKQPEERNFPVRPQTAVCLHQGLPAVLFERQGKVLRVFAHDCLAAALKGFAEEFHARRIFPDKKRLVVKEYPPAAADALAGGGFVREMQDYALYRR